MVALTTPIIMSRSPYGAYFLFGGSIAITTIVCFLCMTETRNKSLEEIDISFKKNVARRMSVAVNTQARRMSVAVDGYGRKSSIAAERRMSTANGLWGRGEKSQQTKKDGDWKESKTKMKNFSFAQEARMTTPGPTDMIAPVPAIEELPEDPDGNPKEDPRKPKLRFLGPEGDDPGLNGEAAEEPSKPKIRFAYPNEEGPVPPKAPRKPAVRFAGMAKIARDAEGDEESKRRREAIQGRRPTGWAWALN